MTRFNLQNLDGARSGVSSAPCSTLFLHLRSTLQSIVPWSPLHAPGLKENLALHAPSNFSTTAPRSNPILHYRSTLQDPPWTGPTHEWITLERERSFAQLQLVRFNGIFTMCNVAYMVQCLAERFVNANIRNKESKDYAAHKVLCVLDVSKYDRECHRYLNINCQNLHLRP